MSQTLGEIFVPVFVLLLKKKTTNSSYTTVLVMASRGPKLETLHGVALINELELKKSWANSFLNHMTFDYPPEANSGILYKKYGLHQIDNVGKIYFETANVDVFEF